MPWLTQLKLGIDAVGRRLAGRSGRARRAVQQIFEENFDGLVVIGEELRIIAASRVAAHLLLGAPEAKLVGRLAREVLPDSMSETVERALAEGQPGVPTPMALTHIGDPQTGLLVQYVVNLSELSDGRGRVAGLTFWDETERRQREEELAFRGSHDHLTGALSRSELVRIIEAALADDRQRAEGLAVLVLDLARFRMVNETLGHSCGDMVLKQVFGRLRTAGLEVVARISGDVFAMVRPGRCSDEELQRICEALIERVTIPYVLTNHRAMVGAAIGVTHSDISGYDAEVLLSHADMALNAAKHLPGNNFVRFTRSMDEELKGRQEMDSALRTAMERRQLSIAFQPQVMLESGETVGVEALVRWRHPRLGMVSPEQFIPLAEETGQILEIGRWVLETACRDVAAWPVPTRLAVNVSPIQFELADVVGEVQAALRNSGLPAHRLDIEITEGLFVSKAPLVIDALQRLRNLGVGIALDDFGTGYSSLSYLGRLPVDKIKIDQSFVRSLPGDAESGAIIRAVMTLSETLGKVVIAEGIETADQAWMLRMMGCKLGQGYYFGRPRNSAEMIEWFEKHQEQQAKAG